MRVEQVRARERRKAAVHEAGHVVVARSFGLKASANVIPVDTEPFGSDRLFVGKTWLCKIERLSRRRQCMIAVAGSIAELVWSDEYVDEFYWTEPDIMSATDWQLAGCDPGAPDRWIYRAIPDVEALLSREGPLWATLCKEARKLIVECRAKSERRG